MRCAADVQACWFACVNDVPFLAFNNVRHISDQHHVVLRIDHAVGVSCSVWILGIDDFPQADVRFARVQDPVLLIQGFGRFFCFPPLEEDVLICTTVKI